jgi:hypothetical protein
MLLLLLFQDWAANRIKEPVASGSVEDGAEINVNKYEKINL